jgi:hypothetical protein
MIDRLRTFGNEAPLPVKVVPQQVRVRVMDGSGQKLAQDTLIKLQQHGFQSAGYGEAAKHAAESEIRYGPNQLAAAKALLPYVDDAKLVPDSSLTDTLVLVIGDTFVGLTTDPTATTLPPAPVTPAPVVDTTVPPKTAKEKAPSGPTTTTIPAGSDCT